MYIDVYEIGVSEVKHIDSIVSLEVIDNCIIITLLDNERTYFVIPDLLIGRFIHYVNGFESGRLFLVNSEGKCVYFFDVNRNKMTELTKLNRNASDRSYDPGGLERLDLIPVGDDFLVVYEGGIIYVETDMPRVRWRHDHQYIDWFFDHVRDETVWYMSESDGIWGYRMKDGARVTS